MTDDPADDFLDEPHADDLPEDLDELVDDDAPSEVLDVTPAPYSVPPGVGYKTGRNGNDYPERGERRRGRDPKTGEVVPRKPLPKISRRERKKRINMVARMLVNGYRKSDIKDALAEAFGYAAGTAERYISDARETLREYQSDEPDDIVGASLGFWFGILKDSAADIVTKAGARDRLDRLLRVDRLIEDSREMARLANEEGCDPLGLTHGGTEPATVEEAERVLREEAEKLRAAEAEGNEEAGEPEGEGDG